MEQIEKNSEMMQSPQKLSLIQRKWFKNLIFWTRFIVWIGIAIGIPIYYIVSHFGIFKDTDKALNGWAYVIILILFVGFMTVMKYIKQSGYGMIKQVATSILSYLPLAFLWLILYALKDHISDVLNVIAIITICGVISSPINPLPKWAFEHNIQLSTTTAIKWIKNAWTKIK